LKREVVADTADQADASPAEDEEPKHEDEGKDEESPSITEMLVELGRDVSVLVLCETQLAASRNMPEVRRVARDIAGALITVLAFLTAFVFANVAAMDGLTHVMAPWLAALVLCVVWLALGAALALALMVRAGHVTGWKWWRIFSDGREESLEDLERARAEAERAVRETLLRIAPAMTIEIASASISVAGDMAGDVVGAGADMAGDVVGAGADMAGDVVDAGAGLLEASDDIVESLTEDLPGGSVVNQMWDVVLVPGRLGVKVATTVFRRGGPRSDHSADGEGNSPD
jgi:hypothetical protein